MISIFPTLLWVGNSFLFELYTIAMTSLVLSSYSKGEDFYVNIKRVSYYYAGSICCSCRITGIRETYLEKYFISNADVSLISACSSMGELMIIVVSAAFCTKKAGKWFDKLFYFFLFVSAVIQISIAVAGPEEIIYRFYANTLNEYLILAIAGKVLGLLYNRLMQGEVLFKFSQALVVSIGGSRFFGYTMATIIPNFSIDTSLWIVAIADIICSLIEVFLFQQAHKMIASGIKEGGD